MDAVIEQKARGASPNSFNLNRIVLLAALGLVLRGFFIYEPSLIPMRLGDTIPEFKLELFTGETLDRSGISGNPTVFFFYAAWCPCSNYSASFIKRGYEEFSPRGLTFVAVGFQDTKEDLRSFADRHKLPFMAGADPGNEVANAFGIGTPPTTLFVDSKGVVRSIFIGKIKKYGDISLCLEGLVQGMEEGNSKLKTGNVKGTSKNKMKNFFSSPAL